MEKKKKRNYPTSRISIVLTEEVFVEIQATVTALSKTLLSYKYNDTNEASVVVSPDGAVTFVSELLVGRVAAEEITKTCDKLNKEDTVNYGRKRVWHAGYFARVCHLEHATF